MKRLIGIAALLVLAVQLMAQNIEYDFSQENDEEIRTIFNSVDIWRISGFGGPSLSFTNVNNDFGVMVGGGGGVLINNFFFGGYGEGLANSMPNSTQSYRDFYFGHGGFWLGYEIGHKKLIHPVINARIGWGGVGMIDSEINHYVNDNIFVFAPGILAEINLTEFFKMNAGIEYRRVFGVNQFTGIGNEDFSSIGVNVNFIFGWFK